MCLCSELTWSVHWGPSSDCSARGRGQLFCLKESHVASCSCHIAVSALYKRQTGSAQLCETPCLLMFFTGSYMNQLANTQLRWDSHIVTGVIFIGVFATSTCWQWNESYCCCPITPITTVPVVTPSFINVLVAAVAAAVLQECLEASPDLPNNCASCVIHSFLLCSSSFVRLQISKQMYRRWGGKALAFDPDGSGSLAEDSLGAAVRSSVLQ